MQIVDVSTPLAALQQLALRILVARRPRISSPLSTMAAVVAPPLTFVCNFLLNELKQTEENLCREPKRTKEELDESITDPSEDLEKDSDRIVDQVERMASSIRGTLRDLSRDACDENRKLVDVCSEKCEELADEVTVELRVRM